MIGFKRSDPTPLYLQVKASLQCEIAGGRYAPGAPLPTERELAARLKLNRMTVRRALNELAREGFVCRIPGRGTFLPGGGLSDSASVETPRPRAAAAANDELMIALAAPFDQLPRDGSSFYFRAMQGMEAACEPGVSLALRRMNGDAPRLAARLKADRGVCGIIAMALSGRELLQPLAATGLPLVVFDAGPSDCQAYPNADAVAHANEEGAFAATRALLDMGHREIACLVHATSNDPASALKGELALERQRGFERAFTSRNLPIRRELIIPAIPSCESGYVIAQQMLRPSAPAPRPTAFFTTVDELAVGAVAGAETLGLRVPEQISAVGFADLGLFSTPALSTVRLQIESSGRAAVQLLLERLANPALPARTLVLPAEFIARGTSGVPQYRDNG